MGMLIQSSLPPRVLFPAIILIVADYDEGQYESLWMILVFITRIENRNYENLIL